MHLVGVKVDQISPGPNISSWNKFPSLNLALSEVFMLPSKSRFLLCHTCDDASRRPAPSPSPFDLHQPPPPPSLTRPRPCRSPLWALHLSDVNLVIPHTRQLHPLHPSEEGWGALPGEVGINLSSHHSCFLLLSACLIKLSPSPMRRQHHFSINFPVPPSVPPSPPV